MVKIVVVKSTSDKVWNNVTQPQYSRILLGSEQFTYSLCVEHRKYNQLHEIMPADMADTWY